jgi:hypothetical protein
MVVMLQNGNVLHSLKCRLAIHVSKVDSNWKTYIAEALASEYSIMLISCLSIFITVLKIGLYIGYFEAKLTTHNYRPIVDIERSRDTLNAKSHHGKLLDPVCQSTLHQETVLM